MITLEIPGRGSFSLQYLVTDVNGTLAVDGYLLDGVAEALARLRPHLEILMLTADTHGRQKYLDEILGMKARRLLPGGEAEQKAAVVRELGAEHVVALGQGANDALMLKEAAIGICLISPEGTALETLLSADVAAPDILSALGMLENPMRLKATLRR